MPAVYSAGFGAVFEMATRDFSPADAFNSAGERCRLMFGVFAFKRTRDDFGIDIGTKDRDVARACVSYIDIA